MNYKTLNPCILIQEGKAVHWFDDRGVFDEDVIQLAKYYEDMGADELLLFDLSNESHEKDEIFNIIRKINREISIPTMVGGNIRRLEDVKKILYAGSKRAILNFSKPDSLSLIGEVSKRFGKDRIAVSLRDFDELYKHQNIIEEYSSEIVFMHRLDLDSIGYVTTMPSIVVTDTMEQEEILKILKNPAIKGVSGKFINQKGMGYVALKGLFEEKGIRMSTFKSAIEFADLLKDKDGLVSVIVQEYKTKEVLMQAYMNEDAYKHTLKSGKMTYYSRSRKKRWIKGETSGHFQMVKSLATDCDNDSLLAMVEQIGPACHTGSKSCFFNKIIENEENLKPPQDILEGVYQTIVDRKANPKEGSYTNYLLEKGLDKILKKMGEEAAEIIIAAKNPNPEEVKYEIADFLYHAMVLMVEKNITWEDISRELADR